MSELKRISASDLAALADTGAALRHEPPPAFDVSGIVSALRGLIEKRPDHTALLAAVDELTSAVAKIELTAPQTDLTPLLRAIESIKQEAPVVHVTAPKPTPVAYQLTVERDQRGLLSSAVFTPIIEDM